MMNLNEQIQMTRINYAFLVLEEMEYTGGSIKEALDKVIARNGKSALVSNQEIINEAEDQVILLESVDTFNMFRKTMEG